MDKFNLLPQQKYCLSIDEAAEYSMIGKDRLRVIIENDETLDWVLHIGTWTRIKRPQFEKWLNEQIWL